VTCREATEFLSDYLAGELGDAIAAEFHAHLGRCVNCRAFLEQFRNTIQAEAGAYAADDADATTVMPEELVRGIVGALKIK
jgi:predicted anti-sigma-YlaC factor YlaD